MTKKMTKHIMDTICNDAIDGWRILEGRYSEEEIWSKCHEELSEIVILDYLDTKGQNAITINPIGILNMIKRHGIKESYPLLDPMVSCIIKALHSGIAATLEDFTGRKTIAKFI